MPDPRLEQIAQDILKTVGSIQPASGANFTYTAIRPTQIWPSPKTGLIEIVQDGRPTKTPLEQTPTGWVEWTQPFVLTGFVLPDETNTTPIDQMLNQIWADVHNALLVDVSRGGHATDTLMDEPEFYRSPQGFAAVEINVSVQYRTLYGDAYQPATTP